MSFKIIIQARTGSTRLPNKIQIPFYKSETILDILISNLKLKFNQSDIILATSNSLSDSTLKEVSEKHQIIFFQGEENDVLKRFLDCANKYDIKKIVRICADNPFLSPEYIETLISELEKNFDLEYVSYQWPDKTPVMLSHIGLFAEAFKTTFVEKISTLTDSKFYHEHVTNYLYFNRQKFNAKFLSIPKTIENRRDIRLTIDTKNDFLLCQEIYLNWQQYQRKDLNSLLEIIENKPLLLKKMQIEIEKNAK